MERNYMKILIEGTDFSGKTTLAKKIKKYIDQHDSCIYFHMPKGRTEESRTLYDNIKSERRTGAKDIKILLSHYYNSEYVLNTNSNMVVDRSILSFCCYQNIDPELIKQMMVSFEIPTLEFDLAFCYVCDGDAIKERMNRTNDSLDEYYLSNVANIMKNYSIFPHTDLFDCERHNRYFIDSSDMSEDDMFEGAKEVIDEVLFG